VSSRAAIEAQKIDPQIEEIEAELRTQFDETLTFLPSHHDDQSA
jgi:hypothetical protein